MLRPLCGHDEALVDAAGSVDLIAFLDRLLTDTPGTTVGPGKAAQLAVCDCDRLCAALYLNYFGERVDGRITCADCRVPFDLSFSLPEMMDNLAEHRSANASGPDGEGVFTLRDGRRFRLPTVGE